MVRRLPVLIAVLLLAACGRGAEKAPDTPSGRPVPRWISIRSEPVSARAGPGFDYEVRFQYQARGLPVQVVEETRDWRKVCDPRGQTAWVHHTRTSGRRTAFNRGAEALPLRASPRDDAEVRALLAPQSIAGLDRCKDGWCRLEVDGQKGWVRQSAVFGGSEEPVCAFRPRRRLNAAPPAAG
ncbi:SH3 domain-containing protein [Brevundimonas sp. 2R-24]|uniref:SH3 domain-containing protein n=1 Tax=Peiella sedimenti TaxID=3061083 RepID=A0ABT8SL80_9CAUL|nr:SH3 domain-containing protein [Caulobacteraceae bacterium XZ-24]